MVKFIFLFTFIIFVIKFTLFVKSNNINWLIAITTKTEEWMYFIYYIHFIFLMI